MYPTQFHPSPIKDGRRILGEKPTNACLSPARNRNGDAATPSPVKRSLFEYPSITTSPSKKLLPSPSFAGQKRSIDQVEDLPVNKGGLHLRDIPREEVTGENASRSPQKQLLHAMDSNAPSTPTPTPQEQEQQQHDFIPSLNVADNQSHAHNQTRTIPEDPETRKTFIQEKANLLRTRIQSAMRRVSDHQLDRRLSDLEAHSRKHPRLSNRQTQPQHDNHTRHRATTTVTATITHATTTTSPLSETTPRTLQPAPNLKPVGETTSDDKSDNSAPGLSSPPLSANNTTDDPMRTPTQNTSHNHRRSESPMQLSSPPATIMRSGASRQKEGHRGDESGGIPSQKGDAVDGLLKLMNTAEKSENTDTWTG